MTNFNTKFQSCHFMLLGCLQITSPLHTAGKRLQNTRTKATRNIDTVTHTHTHTHTHTTNNTNCTTHSSTSSHTSHTGGGAAALLMTRPSTPAVREGVGMRKERRAVTEI